MGSAALPHRRRQSHPGSGPWAVAPVRGLTKQLRCGDPDGRRHLQLGHQLDGRPVQIAIRGRTVIIAGEPGSASRGWPACIASS
jgi:hypothetical protein